MDKLIIEKASGQDVDRILEIQKTAFMVQAELYHDFEMPPMQETREQVLEDIAKDIVLVARENGVVVGSIRSRAEGDSAEIRRLSVAPARQKKGIATKLIKAIEEDTKEARHFWLFTGSKSYDNLKLYRKLGYHLYNQVLYDNRYVLVYLEKNLK
ncbi:MAG: GNAT family N-acetyltransferase [Clostridia bacterium]